MDFKLSENFLEEYKNKQPKFGPLGYITYKRTYARSKPDGTTEEFWETAKRVVEGTYNIQKSHCKNLGVEWNNKKAQNSAQEMYRRIWDFKFLPPGRGLWMMGADTMDRHQGALFNCFAGETEIITADGVKKISDVVGTTQKLLTSTQGWVDAPISSFGHQELMKITLSRSGVEKVIFATPDHRWFACNSSRKNYKEVLTKDLIPGKHLLKSIFGQGIKLVKPSPFGIAQGFVFGDGSTTSENSANCVHLFGEKDSVLSTYFSLCPSYITDGGTRYTSIPNYFKDKPSINENKSFLLGWLMGYFAADGSCQLNGQVVISSTNKDNILFVRDVCCKLGIGYNSINEDTRISNLTGKEFTMYRLTLMRQHLTEDFFLINSHKQNFINNPSKFSFSWSVKSVEKTNRVEEVFCATVPNTASFALEGHILTGNCAYRSTESLATDLAEPFCWVMEFLMLGTGCGYGAEGAGTVTIKEPNRSSDPFIVPDTREGWVEALRSVISPFSGKGSLPSNFDYSLVRKAGEPIKGFGGISSGPEPLMELLTLVEEILTKRIGQKITVTDINDIMNLIGRCVVSGNVRRSALISLGNSDDDEFLNLKNPEINSDRLMHHGWASNNSVFATKGMDYAHVAKQTAINGEPGYIWLENNRQYGRFKDLPDNRDYRVAGCNPCAEQSLENGECCCLVEVFPANHDSYKDYETTLKYAYLYGKTVTLLKTHSALTNAVMQRNRRIGTSNSGIVQAINKFGRSQFFDMCDKGYAYLQNLDKQYSEWFCIPRSIKMTTVKPSGSTSLLPGNTPGIHFPHSEYYIRRIRFQENSPMVPVLQNNGYPVEKDAYSPNTVCVSFPVKEEYYSRGKADVSMWEQLELAAQMQYYWSDNSVSITVTVKPEEFKDIKYALELYESRLKTVSFLPLEDHKYVQAPYETITKEQYESMVQNITPVTSFDNSKHEVTEIFCSNDVCEIKIS